MNLVPPLERQPSSRTDIDHPKMIFNCPPLLRLSSCVPPFRYLLVRVHSPKTSLPSFGQSPPSDWLVPPSWFRTTSTVYSAHRPRVCCTPKPD